MPIDPQQIAQRIIDTIARTQGDSSLTDESFVVNERVVRDRHVRGAKETKTPKVGYVYRKKVSGSTALACPKGDGDSGEGGGEPGEPVSSFNVPYYLPSDYYPIPAGETRIMTVTRLGASGSNYAEVTHPDGRTESRRLSESSPGFLVGTFVVSSQLVIRAYSLPITSRGILATINDVQYSIQGEGTGTEYFADVIDLSTIGGLFTRETVKSDSDMRGEYPLNEGGFKLHQILHFNNIITCSFDRPVNPPPTGSMADDRPAGEEPTPEDPNDPGTPDPNNSFEFWYNSAIAKTPIKLKSLAFNQPLEAKPFIVHKSSSLSMVILKYGKASNDGGVPDDLCKLSLLTIKGTRQLSVTETVYSWSQEGTLQTKLKGLKCLFYAIVGSKTRQENINPANLVTAGKLSPRLKCFTHRNLTNLKQDVYLVDPTTGDDSLLDDLMGEGLYGLNAIANLKTTAQIVVALRYFDLKPNPSYAGSSEDCASNPAYKLIEKKTRRIKKVKVKGLNSTDDSIEILTLNCAVV